MGNQVRSSKIKWERQWWIQKLGKWGQLYHGWGLALWNVVLATFSAIETFKDCFWINNTCLRPLCPRTFCTRFQLVFPHLHHFSPSVSLTFLLLQVSFCKCFSNVHFYFWFLSLLWIPIFPLALNICEQPFPMPVWGRTQWQVITSGWTTQEPPLGYSWVRSRQVSYYHTCNTNCTAERCWLRV